MLLLALSLVLLIVCGLLLICLVVLVSRNRNPLPDPRVYQFAELAKKYFEKYLAEVQKNQKPLPEIDPEFQLQSWKVDSSRLNKN